MRIRFIGLVLAGVVSLQPLSPVQAQAPPTAGAAGPSKEDMAAAKALYASGAASFQQGDYAAARTAFEASYRLSLLPDMLSNLALVAERQDRLPEAIAYLEDYLAHKPAAPDREAIQRHIAELAAQRAATDEKAAEQKKVQQLEEELRQERRPTAAAPVNPPRRVGRLPPTPSLGLAGGGVGLLIIGIGLGGAALGTAQQVDGALRFDRGLHDQGRAMDAAAISFDVIGALALGAGAAWAGVWYLRNRERKPAAFAAQGLGLSGLAGGL